MKTQEQVRQEALATLEKLQEVQREQLLAGLPTEISVRVGTAESPVIEVEIRLNEPYDYFTPIGKCHTWQFNAKDDLLTIVKGEAEALRKTGASE